MTHNIEAEQQLLGAILVDNPAYHRVADVLRPEHFHDPVHARIFDIAGRRIQSGHLVSPVTMKLTLEGDEGLKQLGGPAYLVRLAGSAISSLAAGEYAGIILEAAARRALAEALQDGQKRLSEGVDSLEAKMALLTALQQMPDAGGASSYSLLKSVVDSTEAALADYQGKSAYLQTGLPALDGILKGVGPGNYCLIGGAPSMGKTSLAVDIACNISANPEKGVVFVSLEMSKEELANRIISRASRIPYSAIRDAGTMSEDDFRKWLESSQAVSKAFAMKIVPPHVRDIPAIYAAVNRAALDLPGGKPGAVILDYAQLVRSSAKGRYEQMTEVSVQIKQLARQLNCPVFPLVQLSRDIGKREDRRPHLYDIRDSGQFEQDADQAVFCHRESYWLERDGPRADKSGKLTEEARSEWAGQIERWKGKMEIIVRKNRHGRIGTAEVGFHEPTNRFWRLGDEQEEFR